MSLVDGAGEGRDAGLAEPAAVDAEVVEVPLLGLFIDDRDRSCEEVFEADPVIPLGRTPRARRCGIDGGAEARSTAPECPHPTVLGRDTNGSRRVRSGKGDWSGRRDSNPRHSAWEADTLPTELLPLESARTPLQTTTASSHPQSFDSSTARFCRARWWASSRRALREFLGDVGRHHPAGRTSRARDR